MKHLCTHIALLCCLVPAWAFAQTDSSFKAHRVFSHPFEYAASNFRNNDCDMYRVDVRREADSLLFSFVTEQQDTHFVCPVLGEKTSSFGPRHLYSSKFHYGTDLDLHEGDTVLAAFDGVVRVAKYDNGGYGNVIVIAHADGLETLYAHLSKMSVKKGDQVKAGDFIGKGGSTGRSTGAHLHFEMRFLGEQFNPELLVDFDEHRLKTPVFTIKRQHFKHLDIAEAERTEPQPIEERALQQGVGGGPDGDRHPHHNCAHHH
ncbi:MAG: M23 family metallopeptidase [Bacteroidota bacterium]